MALLEVTEHLVAGGCYVANVTPQAWNTNLGVLTHVIGRYDVGSLTLGAVAYARIPSGAGGLRRIQKGKAPRSLPDTGVLSKQCVNKWGDG